MAIITVNATALPATLDVSAGNTYKIANAANVAIDIFNNTSGEIKVNKTGIFAKTNGVGNYLEIPQRGSYNGFRPDTGIDTIIHIYCAASGKVSIIQKGW